MSDRKHIAEQFEFEFVKDLDKKFDIEAAMKHTAPMYMDWPTTSFEIGEPVCNTKAIAKLELI